MPWILALELVKVPKDRKGRVRRDRDGSRGSASRPSARGTGSHPPPAGRMPLRSRVRPEVKRVSLERARARPVIRRWIQKARVGLGAALEIASAVHMTPRQTAV